MGKATNLIIFVAGAVLGSLVTYKYLKTKYEYIAQEEEIDLDSVKEAFSKSNTVESETEEVPIKNISSLKEKPNLNDVASKYTNILHKLNYTNYSNAEEIPVPVPFENEDCVELDEPEVIPPDEFGEFEDYDKISLTYYSDYVLADENDDLVEDIENTVGAESLETFGEWEDDSVFVRNDRLKAYFEILLDQRKYSDVLKTKPPTAPPRPERKPHEVD